MPEIGKVKGGRNKPPPKISLAPAKSSKYIQFHESQSSVSLADHKIGPVRVNCCLFLSKTRWGELDGKKAGLMYLDLTFDQPEECMLASATVTLTLSPVMDNATTEGFDPGLEVTEYFGPQMLTGEKTEKSLSKKLTVQPEAGAYGFTAGGIGYERDEESTLVKRWKFEGKRFPADIRDKSISVAADGGRYRQIVWRFEENYLDRQPIHRPTIHTGLVFEHEAHSFLLNLQVKGKLRSRHQHLLQKLVCPPRNRIAQTTALVEAGKLSMGKNEHLKDLAQGLDQAMTEKNRNPVPEVPGPRPLSDDQLPKRFKQEIPQITDRSDNASDGPPLQPSKSKGADSTSSPDDPADDCLPRENSPDPALLSLAQQIVGSGKPLGVPNTIQFSQADKKNETTKLELKMAGSKASEISTTQSLVSIVWLIPWFLATVLKPFLAAKAAN